MSELKVDVAQLKYVYKWYKDERFPLLPIVRIRQPNEQNTWSMYFRWMVFQFWTMDSPDIGFGVNLDDRMLEIRLRLPYLITGVFIHIFPWSIHQKFWRKARGRK